MIQKIETLLSERNDLSCEEFKKILNEFKLVINSLEKTLTKQEILDQIKIIRTIAGESPFLKRAQEWPRGYEGDFETINYIINSKNLAPQNTFGYLIEDYFLNSDICKQQ
jgi:extracellular factor (EF) 3-hydroxypalmitic acid methyl ester biosynthesis protein